MQNVGSGRLITPDIAKGIVILGVLVTHLYATPHTPAGPSGPGSLPLMFAYSALMAFLVIAGYFYRPRGFVYNVKRRVMKLAIVFVACTLILPVLMYGYFCALGYSIDFVDGYIGCLKNLIGCHNVFEPMDGHNHAPQSLIYVCTGYYFINLIIIASIVFYAIADRVLENVKTVAVSIIVLTGITAAICYVTPVHLPFQAELVPIAVAFMVFGAFLARHRFIENMEAEGLKSKRFWVMFLGSIVVSLALIYILPPGRGFIYAYFGEYGGISAYPYFIECCLLTFVTLGIAMLVSRVPYLSRYISFLGRHTLAILLLHITIAKSIGYLLTDRIGQNTCPILGVPESIFVILFTATIAAVIGHYAPVVLKRILKGRSS